ncbi:hypothetical protein OK006_10606 [Actinobacteria bacterium OK006]|nr:hypothetical protein OK006_10606 [Actinobacteria bacterium OK006]
MGGEWATEWMARTASRRRRNTSPVGCMALKTNLADHVRNTVNEPADARSHRGARQEEPEEAAHNCVHRIQATLPDQDENENAQEHDGGDTNGHRTPSSDSALLMGGLHHAGGGTTGAGSGPIPLVWRRTTWTPLEEIRNRFAFPATRQAPARPNDHALGRFVSMSYCGTPQHWRQNIPRTHSRGDITCVIPAPPGVIEVARTHSRGGMTCISSRCEAATGAVAN